MLNRSSCSFLLVAILVLMLIHYTTTGSKENFNVGYYNKQNNLDTVLKQTLFSTKYKTFYLAVGNKRKGLDRFININNDGTIITDTTDAAKIHFVEDVLRPDLWHIEIYDDFSGKILRLVNDLKENFKAFHVNPNSLKEAHLSDLYDIEQEGSNSEDTSSIVWSDKLSNNWVTDTDNLDVSLLNAQKRTMENRFRGNKRINLVFEEKGAPATFRVETQNGTIQLLYFESSTNILYPITVSDDNEVFVNYASDGEPTPFRLYVGNNITGGIKGAAFWKNHYILNFSPAPQPGTFITLGNRSGDVIKRAQYINKSRTRSGINELIGDIEINTQRMVDNDIIPYLFKVLCPPKLIKTYLEHGGKELSQFNNTEDLNIDNVPNKVIDPSSISGATSSEYKSYIPTSVTNTSYKSSPDNDVQTNVYSSFEKFSNSNQPDKNSITLEDPNLICIRSHLYVVEVYDYTGRYIILPNNTTIDTTTGNKGPNMPLLITANDIKDKNWVIWGDVANQAYV